MPLKLIIDTQLPPSLSGLFRKYKINSVHTTDFPNGHLLNDKQIIRIAVQQNRVMVTKDSDFFENFVLNGAPPKILLQETGNIKNSDLFKIIENKIFSIINLLYLSKCRIIEI